MRRGPAWTGWGEIFRGMQARHSVPCHSAPRRRRVGLHHGSAPPANDWLPAARCCSSKPEADEGTVLQPATPIHCCSALPSSAPSLFAWPVCRNACPQMAAPPPSACQTRRLLRRARSRGLRRVRCIARHWHSRCLRRRVRAPQPARRRYRYLDCLAGSTRAVPSCEILPT